MNSHELAKRMLAVPVGSIFISIDVCRCSEDCGLRAMGNVIEINSLPTNDGFGNAEVQLVAEGGLNLEPKESETDNKNILEMKRLLQEMGVENERLKLELSKSISRSAMKELVYKLELLMDKYKSAISDELCSSIRHEAKVQHGMIKQLVESLTSVLSKEGK
ncbi:MAG: hypothetical protein K0U78_14935 [Actinomycetia bacterium]|nr:hypothetical protein [Actinomycetes bacterium]